MSSDLPIGMMGQPEVVVARYWKMVKAGESPRMAEILACRQAPSLETDTSHFAGMGMASLEKTCGKAYADKVHAEARKAGISVTANSVYNGSVADGRGGGDPEAWLLAGDGRDKFRRVIEKRGGECESLKANGASRRLEQMPVKEEAFQTRKRNREAAKRDKIERDLKRGYIKPGKK